MNQPVIICSNCRTPNPSRNLYCQSCGRPLIPAADPPAPSDVTQPSPAPPSDQGPTVASTPGQPYSASPEQPYEPKAGTGVSPETNVEYPSQPAPGYQPQGSPPPPQPGVQPGYPPPFQGAGTPQGYARAQPQPDFFEKTQSRVSSFFGQFGRENFPVKAESWSTLFSGAGGLAEEIEQKFVEDFEKRDLPYVDLGRTEVTSGLVQRVYHVARHRSGSVTAYVNPNGRDLMVGWELNVQQKPNWKMISILGAITLFIPFFISLAFGLNFWTFLFLWIIGIAFFTLAVFVAAAITGKIIKGDIWALFIEKPDPAALQELSALAASVQQSLQNAIKNAGVER